MGGVSCHVMDLYNYSIKKEDHLYIFEDYFCLNQDYPKAGEATLSELVFEFIGHGTNWKVKGCGVRLLEDEEKSGRDEDEDDEAGDGDSNEVEEDIKDDVDKTQEGEESRRDDDDAETRSKPVSMVYMRMESPYTIILSVHSVVVLSACTLPSSLRFKACILLSKEDSLEKEELLMGGVSCHVMDLYNYSIKKEDHLYIFEDYFCLNQDYPKAGEATLSELVFEFIGHGTNWKVKGCGVRLLEDEEKSGRDEDEDDEAGDGDSNEVEEDIKDDVDKTQEGEESRRDDDDAETRSKPVSMVYMRMESPYTIILSVHSVVVL
ncbi:hypothetical protein DY000_02018627 [Brassica cretica]|uniref:Uncharacterized protein n=2 Tax=Brassica cretica TaxID=69181 RepID=A0ABQ7DCD8_BRACR|nr:hypothetical protein DY000_02018627 [Brassica cretica]